MRVSDELWDGIKELSAYSDFVLCMVCQKEVRKPGHEYVSEHMITRKTTKERGEDCLMVTIQGKRRGVIHLKCKARALDEWPQATIQQIGAS